MIYAIEASIDEDARSKIIQAIETNLGDAHLHDTRNVHVCDAVSGPNHYFCIHCPEKVQLYGRERPRKFSRHNLSSGRDDCIVSPYNPVAISVLCLP